MLSLVACIRICTVNDRNQVRPYATVNVMDEEPLLFYSIRNFFVHHPRKSL